MPLMVIRSLILHVIQYSGGECESWWCNPVRTSKETKSAKTGVGQTSEPMALEVLLSSVRVTGPRGLSVAVQLGTWNRPRRGKASKSPKPSSIREPSASPLHVLSLNTLYQELRPKQLDLSILTIVSTTHYLPAILDSSTQYAHPDFHTGSQTLQLSVPGLRPSQVFSL